MPAFQENSDSKRGKQNPDLLPHKKNIKATFEAHHLEGQVKNRGIKNLGHQKKKPKV